MTIGAHGGPASAASGIELCNATAVQEKGRAWVWEVLEYRRPLRAFALRHEGRVHAYLNRCMHVPTEMDWQPGEFLDLERRYILCSIHGAAYEPADGLCIAGPCVGARLKAIRTEERDGKVYWYPSRDIQPVMIEAPAPEGSP